MTIRTSESGRRLVSVPVPANRGPFAGPDGSAPAAADAPALIDALNRAFAEFKEKNDAEIAAIKARKPDVVATEQVDRISAAVGDLQSTVNRMSLELTSAVVNGAGRDAAEPAAAAAATYSRAYHAWLRGHGPNRQPSASVVGALQAAQDSLLAARAELSSSSDPDGGFLVPTEMDAEISRVQELMSPMRRLADVASTSAAVSAKLVNLGGATSGWVGEKTSRSETSTPTLSKLEFPVFEVYAEPHATQTILDDVGDRIVAWLAGEVAIEFAEEEGDAWVRGDGNAKPRGYLSYTKVANTSYAWGKVGYVASGVAAALTDSTNNGYDALTSIVYALKSRYRASAAWKMNDATTATVRKIRDSEGNYMWQPSVQAGQPATLFGYAVETDDHDDDIGAGKYPIAFADWRTAYRIRDRGASAVLIDPYTAKPYVKYYTTKRVGGGLQNFEAIKLLKIAAS